MSETRPGYAGYNQNNDTQVIVQTVYQNPLTASTYDPDGLQAILSGGDDVDYDDQSLWDAFPWVTHGVVDASVAGPVWEDMDRDAQETWYDDNKDLVESHLGESIFNIDFDNPWTTLGGVNASIGSVYDEIRQQGAFGGTEVDYSYYQNDPLFSFAFATVNWDDYEDLDAPDWSTPGEGVTQEHLQVGVEYIARTFNAVANDQLRMPWNAELPGKWEPKEMASDYKTPFEIPGIVKGLPGPTMSENLKDVKFRSGSNMEGQFKNLQENTPNQEGTNMAAIAV